MTDETTGAPEPEESEPQPAPGGDDLDNFEDEQPTESPDGASGNDLRWVWREVRKRVFIKLPFSLGVAEALQAVIPIVLDEGNFVVGLTSRDYPLSANLLSENVRNTIEAILRQASRQYIHFEV